MSKKSKEPTKIDTSGGKALVHNPFAALSGKTIASKPLSSIAPIRIAAPKAPAPLPAPRVRLRHESTGRSGKVITRISGLPPASLDAIAARLKKALGCGATVENMDVILQGSLEERASAWIAKAGDLRLITEDKPQAPASRTAAAEPPVPVRSSVQGLSGMRRSDVKRGQRVAIVLKADQPTGKLTEGLVRDLLTSADYHPRGIKVRLESGDVGRVQVILG